MSTTLNPFASVCMITYNHESYIAQAIEGVLMQKTDFETELVIGEDYSTDRTRSICENYIQKYPETIKLLPAERNIGMTPNFVRTLKACKGKYIALCEGDDYWTDPYKLQKQVDFLETHPDYGMVHSAVDVVDENNNLLFKSDSERPTGDVFYYLLSKSAFIVTCSVCTRSDFIKEIIEYAVKNNIKCVFDYWLWLHIAMRSKVYYMAEITAAYRSHPGGISKLKSTFTERIPLSVLDAVSYKLLHFPERKFKNIWELYVCYCRALTARSLKWECRKKYIYFLMKNLASKPIYFLAFFPPVWRKIKLRVYNKIKQQSV